MRAKCSLAGLTTLALEVEVDVVWPALLLEEQVRRARSIEFDGRLSTYKLGELSDLLSARSLLSHSLSKFTARSLRFSLSFR